MPGLMTIGSSRRLELTDGEQVLFVESSSSPMLEAAGSRPASQLTKAKRRVMSVTSEAALTGSGGASSRAKRFMPALLGGAGLLVFAIYETANQDL